jgi:hypothetical protein
LRRTPPRRGTWRPPATIGEVAQAASGHATAFELEKAPLEVELTTIASEVAAGADDAMTGHAGIAAPAEDRADCPCGARAAGARSHVAVRGQPAGRDRADRGQDPSGKRAGRGSPRCHRLIGPP